MTGVVAHISKMASKLNTINFPKCVLILLFLKFEESDPSESNNIKKNIKNIMSLSTKLVR